MSDENTSHLQASDTPDPPMGTDEAAQRVPADVEMSGASAVKAISPATVNPKESADPNSLQSKTNETPPSFSKKAGKQELRSAPRIRVRWHTDAFIDGQTVQHGFIKDISLTGTDIFIDRNFQKIKFVKLHIYAPPLSKSSLPHVMEVSAKVIYTAYDSNESLFHTGVSFIQFSSESDREYLKSHIAAINHDV